MQSPLGARGSLVGPLGQGGVVVGPLVYDPFDAPDGTPIAGRTPPIAPPGVNWSVLSGTWTIQSGVARQALTGGAHYIAAVDAGRANFTVQADITLPNTPQFFYFGLLLRYLDGDNYWFATFYNVLYNSTVRLFERTSGTETVRAEVSAPGALGATKPLIVSLLGNTITVVDYLTYTSAVGAGRSICGLWSYADSEHVGTGSWDNFKVLP